MMRESLRVPVKRLFQRNRHSWARQRVGSSWTRCTSDVLSSRTSLGHRSFQLRQGSFVGRRELVFLSCKRGLFGESANNPVCGQWLMSQLKEIAAREKWKDSGGTWHCEMKGNCFKRRLVRLEPHAHEKKMRVRHVYRVRGECTVYISCVQ